MKCRNGATSAESKDAKAMREKRKCFNCRAGIRSKKDLFCKKCEGVRIKFPTFHVKMRVTGDGITAHSDAESKYIKNVKNRGHHVARDPNGLLHEIG